MNKYYEQKKKWRENNIERAREIARNYIKRRLEENPEKWRIKTRESARNYYYRHYNEVRKKDNLRQRVKRLNDKERYNAKQREYRINHPEKFRQYYLKGKEHGKIMARKRLLKKYSLTEEDYNHLLKIQYNKCAICGKEFNGIIPVIDHSHFTGMTRGLLCPACNIILGYVEKQGKEIINSIILYLDSYKQQN